MYWISRIVFVVCFVTLCLPSISEAKFQAVSGHEGWSVEYDTLQPVPWGYEQGFVLKDAAKKEYVLTTTFHKVAKITEEEIVDGEVVVEASVEYIAVKPTTKDIEARVSEMIDRLENPGPEPEKKYYESEVVDLLIEKKYLSIGDSLSDLPIKEK